MIKIDDYRYNAESGNFIIRKNDGFIMGESICLGDLDSIDNYMEEAYTSESYKSFYEKLGLEINSNKKQLPHNYHKTKA